MKSIYKAAICAAFLVGATGAASAQTTVYKGFDANTSSGSAATSNPNSDLARTQFLSALSGTSTESFESFANGASAPLNLSFTGSAGTLGATLSGSGSVSTATRAAPTGSGQFATDGSKYFAVSSANFSITFDSQIAAFGFFATDIESDLQVILNHATGPAETFSFFTLFGTSTSTASGSVNYLGLINTTNPFTSIQFSPGANSSGDIFAFDQMTIGDPRQVTNPPAVPEPATWALMVLGVGAMGGALRRRKQHAVAAIA